MGYYDDGEDYSSNPEEDYSVGPYQDTTDDSYDNSYDNSYDTSSEDGSVNNDTLYQLAMPQSMASMPDRHPVMDEPSRLEPLPSARSTYQPTQQAPTNDVLSLLFPTSTPPAAAPRPTTPAPQPKPQDDTDVLSMLFPSSKPAAPTTPAPVQPTAGSGSLFQGLKDKWAQEGTWGPSQGTPVGSGSLSINPYGARGTPASVTTTPGTPGQPGQPVRQYAPGELPQIDPTNRQTFIQTALPYAKIVESETGLPAEIMVGIAANETGNGNPKYVVGNNYFGIKGANPRTGASNQSATWEVVNGQRVNTTSGFRAYDSPLESFRDFADFLKNNKRYEDALNILQTTHDPAAFIKEVHRAGYATDPNWSNQVLAIASTVPKGTPAPTPMVAKLPASAPSEAPQMVSYTTPYNDGKRPSTTGIVIHSTQGNQPDQQAEFEQTVRYFQNNPSQVSANFVIGPDGTIANFGEDLAAHHAGHDNNQSRIGIELAAQNGNTPYTEAQYRSLEWLTNNLSQKYGFAVNRQSIVGHQELEQGKQQGKTDPGPLFDWNKYIGETQAKKTATTAPPITGSAAVPGVAASVNSGKVPDMRGITGQQGQIYAGDPSIWALCGPVAAMAFVRAVGREPNPQEAKELAASVGWTPGAGMAGPQSEVNLLNKMGVAAHMTQGVDWEAVKADVSRGNPVIIDTPKHYYTVEAYNPQTGKFTVGNVAGTYTTPGGTNELTREQLAAMPFGEGRSAIFLDSPASPLPSVVAGSRRPGVAGTSTVTPAVPADPSSAPFMTGSVGNRPITLWDIATARQVAPPPPPPPAPVPQQAPVQQARPDYDPGRAARAAAAGPRQAAAVAQAAQPASAPDLAKEKDIYGTFLQQSKDWANQVDAITQRNKQKEVDYQHSLQQNIEAGVSDPQQAPQRPAMEPYPQRPVTPVTPNLDAAVDAQNKKLQQQHAEAVHSADLQGKPAPPPPQLIQKPSDFANMLTDLQSKSEAQVGTAGTQAQQDVAARVKQRADAEQAAHEALVNDIARERAATRTDIGTQPVRFEGDTYPIPGPYNPALPADAGGKQPSLPITREVVPGPDSSQYYPGAQQTENRRLYEANEANGSGTVTVPDPSTGSDRVLSNDDDVHNLPEVPPVTLGELRSAGIQLPSYYASRPDSEVYAPAQSGPVLQANYGQASDVEDYINRRNAQYASQGYVTPDEKNNLIAQIGINRTTNQRNEVTHDVETRPDTAFTQEGAGSHIAPGLSAPGQILSAEGRRAGADIISGLIGAQTQIGQTLQGLGQSLHIPQLTNAGTATVDSARRNELNHPGDLPTASTTYRPEHQNFVDGLIESLAPTVVTTLLTAGVGGAASLEATGVKALGLAAGGLQTFAQEGGDVYADAIDKGATPQQAAARMWTHGIAATVLELVAPGTIAKPVGGAISRIPGVQQLGDMLYNSKGGQMAQFIGHQAERLGETPLAVVQNALVEGFQEVGQEFTNIWSESIHGTPDWSNAPSRFLWSFLGGAAMGGGHELVGAHAPETLGAAMAPERSGSPTLFPSNQINLPAAAPTTQTTPNTTPAHPQATPGAPVVPLNVTPSDQPAPQTLSGLNEGLISNSLNDQDQRYTVDAQNVRPDVGTYIENDMHIPQEVLDIDPVTNKPRAGTGILTGAATQALADAERRFGGLNADERSQILDKFHFGDVETTANQRNVLAIAGKHLAENPSDATIIIPAAQQVVSGPVQQATPQQLQQVYTERMGQINTPAAPPATPQTPPAVPTQNTPPAAPTAPTATPARPPGQSTNTAGGPTATEGVFSKLDTNIDRGQFLVSDDENGIVVANHPVRNGDGSFNRTRISPDNLSVLDENQTVSARTVNGPIAEEISQVLGKPSAALFRNNVQEARNAEGSKTFRVKHIVQALGGLQSQNATSNVMSVLGIDGISRKTPQGKQIQFFPHARNRVFSGQLESMRQPASVPGITPTTPAQGKLPDGFRRVWINTPQATHQDIMNRDAPRNRYARPNTDIADGRTEIPVVADPSNIGTNNPDFMTSVPLVVRESDVRTRPDGSLYIHAPEGRYVPEAQGDGARDGTTQIQNKRLVSKLVTPRQANPLDVTQTAREIDAEAIGNTGITHAFQEGELNHQDRVAIANSESIRKLGDFAQRAHRNLTTLMQSEFPTLAKTQFRGFAWTPDVLGFNRTLVSNEHVVRLDPHTTYTDAARWAHRVGVAVNSNTFRRYMAGLMVGTHVHEIAHSIKAQVGIDATGHGGSHADAIRWATQTQAVQDLMAEAYRALDANTLRELQAHTQMLSQSVGKPAVDEDVAGPKPIPVYEDNAPKTGPPAIPPVVPVAEDTTPVEGPKPPRQEQGPRRNLPPRLVPEETPRPTSQTTPNGVLDGDAVNTLEAKNFNKRILDSIRKTDPSKVKTYQDNLKSYSAKYGVTQPGLKSKATRIYNMYQALRGVDFDGDADATMNDILKDTNMDGIQFTAVDGTKRTVTFPHAQGVTSDATRTATEPDTEPRDTRDAGLGNGISPRSNEGRGREDAGAVRERTAGPERAQSGESVRDGSGAVSRDANVGRDYGTNGSNSRPADESRVGASTRGSDGQIIRPTITEAGARNPDGHFHSFGQSSSERTHAEALEAAARDASLPPSQRVIDWRVDNDFKGNKIQLPFIIEDENRRGRFWPDFMVKYADGHVEIHEIKSTRGAYQEDTYHNTEIDPETGQERGLRGGWYVDKKVIAALGGGIENEYGPNVGFQLIADKDPILTGVDPTGNDIGIVKYYNTITDIGTTPRIGALADPVNWHRFVRSHVLAALDTLGITSRGKTRIADVTGFMAVPTSLQDRALNRFGAAWNEGRRILDAHVRDYGLDINNVAVGQSNPATGEAGTAMFDMHGDISAAEKALAEMAKQAGTESDPGTFAFTDDSAGNQFIHTMTIPKADDAILSALSSIQSDPELASTVPTITTIETPNGDTRVVISSRTPDGTNLAENDFLDARDGLVNALNDMGANSTDHNTRIGRITHFTDNRLERGIDNAIERRRRLLDRSFDRGNAFPERSKAADKYIPEAPRRGRSVEEVQHQPTNNTRTQDAQGQERFPEAVTPTPFMAQPVFARQSMDPEVENTRQAQENDLTSYVRQAAAEREPDQLAAAAGATPKPGRPIIPDLDLKKFSRDAQGAIRTAAELIHAKGPLPPIEDTYKRGQQQLGLTERQFRHTIAPHLSQIELEAILSNLDTLKGAQMVMGQNLANATTIPADSDFRDFLQSGLRYVAMYKQLTGQPKILKQGAQLYNAAKQQTARGETDQQHIDRLVKFFHTENRKGSNFAKEFFLAARGMHLLGASAHQVATAWEMALTPQTHLGDWLTDIFYSAMMGPRSAVTATTFNVAMLHMQHAINSLDAFRTLGLVGGAKANVMMQGSYLLGITKAFGSTLETILHGATAEQNSALDYDPGRLRNNRGIFGFGDFSNKPLNLLGTGVEIFWGRFFQAADVFAKTWAYSPNLALEAAQRSAAENNGNVDWNKANYYMDHPSIEMVKNARKKSAKISFQGPMGETGEWLARGQNMPGARLILPFLRSVYHGFMYSLDLTPVIGQIKLATRLVRQSMGKDAPTADSVFSQFMMSTMGAAAGAAIVYGIEHGQLDLTGGPPDDKDTQDEWAALHKQPYRIGWKNGPQYSYGNWAPFNLPLAMIAEGLNAYHKYPTSDKHLDLFGHAVSNMGKAMVDFSFFSSIAEVLNAATNDSQDNASFSKSALGRWFENQYGMLTPWGATAQQIGQAQDPYLRKPIEKDMLPRFFEVIEGRMPLNVPFTERPWPGGRGNLMPALDRWGHPVPNPYYGNVGPMPRVLLPTQETQPTTDPIDLELRRLNEEDGVNKYPNQVLPKYQKHEFTDPKELYYWQKEVGDQSYKNLHILFSTPEYYAAPASGPKNSKDAMIQAAYDSAKEMVWDRSGIIDAGAEPPTPPKYYGIKEQAATEGVPWWQLQQEVDSAISKFNDFKDAAKNGRPSKPLSNREMQLAGMYGRSGARDKMASFDQQQESEEVKSVKSKFTPNAILPFNAKP